MRTLQAIQKGFTLIELTVSVAIFSFVMVIALGALLSISAADKKAETLSTVINNLNSAVEGMSRTIRTGLNYNCGTFSGGDCASGGSLFAFTSNTGSLVVYKYDNSSNCGQTGATKGCISRCISPPSASCATDTGTNYVPITSPDVIITNLTFYLRGSQIGAADNRQPIVTLSAVGYVYVSGTQKTAFNIQTSVEQRLYDI